MGEYSVGIATKNKIYRVAKSLFYEKGIKDTSYKDIGRLAEVNKGLIPYHFKSKNSIAELVLNDFIESMVGAVRAYWEREHLEQAVLDTLVELMMFRLLVEDVNVCRFYYEMQTEAFSFEDATFEIQTEVMKSYARDCGIELSEGRLNTITAMVQGTERELVRLVYERTLGESVEDMVRQDVSCCFFLIGAEGNRVQAWIDRAFELAEGLTMTSDGMFNCSIVRA